MSSSSGRRTVFFPSPRWKTESPARPASSTTASSTKRALRDFPGPFEGLLSPIPPPPANLFAEPAEAFSTDPGVPFLATAGSSGSEGGSRAGSDKEDEYPRRRRFVGGFVTSIGNTVRRSLRRRRRDFPAEQNIRYDQDDVRDSGYASALVPTTKPHRRRPSTAEAVISHESYYPSSAQDRRPSATEAVISHESYGHRRPSTAEAVTSHERHSPYPPSPPWDRRPSTTEAVVSHDPHNTYPATQARRPSVAGAVTSHDRHSYERPIDINGAPYGAYTLFDDKVARRHGAIPLLSPGSPVSAEIEYGSDYAKMDRPVHSDVSFGTYMRRINHFVQDIAALPFSSKTRVTYDYYPEIELRDDPRRRPRMVWLCRDYNSNGHNNSPPDLSKSNPPSTTPKPHSAVNTPHRIPAAEFDLREEFVEAPGVFPMTTSRQTLRRDTVHEQLHIGTVTPIQRRPASQAPHPHSLRWQTFVEPAAADVTWDEARNVSFPQNSSKRRHAKARYRQDIPVVTNAPLKERGQHPKYREGYVPAEFAEEHYGSRYGQGIHSARAGLAPLISEQSSNISHN